MSDRLRDQVAPALVAFVAALLGVVVVGTLLGLTLDDLFPFALYIAVGTALGFLVVPLLRRAA